MPVPYQSRLRQGIGFAMLWLPLLAGAAGAPGSGPEITVRVDVRREIVRTDAKGTRVVEHVPVGLARPGDTLLYTLRAENDGAAPALQTRLEDVIPAGTVLVPDSPTGLGATPMASLDGGRTWQSLPAMLPQEGDAAEPSRPAPPDAYTHLRWVLSEPIDPGQVKEVSFKVRIK